MIVKLISTAATAALLSLLVASKAGAVTIVYDNFGPGDSYSTNLLWALGQQPGLGDIDRGFAFTPSKNGYLYSVEVAISLTIFASPNVLDLWVMDDAGGEPGNILESFNLVDAMGPAGFLNPPVAAMASGNTFLSASEQYWLIASLPDPTTSAGWNFNTTGDIAPLATRFDLGAWTVNNQGSGAFRITVPEPAVIALFGLGMIALGLTKRNKQGNRKAGCSETGAGSITKRNYR